MSSNTPSGHVPQPVKKRGRFSRHSPNRPRAGRPPHSSVPEGFIRDLLDEEDSEEDPDFDADVDISDDDEDDVVDDVLQTDLVPEYLISHDHHPHDVPYQAQRREPSFIPSHQHPADHEFEVDSLDSSEADDDDVDLGSAPVDPVEFDQIPEVSDHPTQDVQFADIELDSDDDEEDPDFEAAVETRVPEAPTEFHDEEEDVHESEARDDEYVQFLLGLVTQDEEPTQEPRPEAARNERAMGGAGEHGEDGMLLNADDDDDFDYLRASAMIQDDPLEYRDDLHVSPKEVAQLLFNNSESNVRPHTRTSHGRKAVNQPIRKPRQGEGLLPLPQLNVLPSPAIAPPPTQQLVPATIQPAGGGQASTGNLPAAAAPLPRSFLVPSPPQIFKLKEQMGVYVQMLTHLHANCRKMVRFGTSGVRESTEAENGTGQKDPVAASARSKVLLQQLCENRRMSLSFHEMINAHVTRMKKFSHGLVHSQGQYMFDYQVTKSAMYDHPAIPLVEPFLRDCETKDPSHLPVSVLMPFAPYRRPDVQRILAAAGVEPQYNAVHRQYTESRLRDGWFAWTAADDNLLAMTIAKYGRESGDFANDLLPHRLEEDCQARVRYLSSRRSMDNPVKRQVLHISTPLNRDEIKLVEVGLKQLGNKIDDPNTWREIQRRLLPNREWSHLQKLWLWRETQRKYKATYRAKLNKKKTLRQETVAG